MRMPFHQCLVGALLRRVILSRQIWIDAATTEVETIRKNGHTRYDVMNLFSCVTKYRTKIESRFYFFLGFFYRVNQVATLQTFLKMVFKHIVMFFCSLCGDVQNRF